MIKNIRDKPILKGVINFKQYVNNENKKYIIKINQSYFIFNKLLL